MIEAEFWEYDDADELTEAVAGDIGFLIEQALDARGDAVVAFPGGKTPLAAFDRLAEKKLRWKSVSILPTDERLVPLSDPLSNVRALAERFLPLGARVIPLTAGKVLDPEGAARVANDSLSAIHWPLDLVWLGMGADGHVASLLNGPDLEVAFESLERVVGVTPDPLPPEAPVKRLSLSASAILSARALTIMITGEDKQKLLEQAIEDAAGSDLPVGRLLARASQAVDIHWCP